MVTAILPAMTSKRASSLPLPSNRRRNTNGIPHENGAAHVNTPSISSELTITPSRFRSPTPPAHGPASPNTEASASKLAGIVGMLTGIGALVALGFFLPLPTRFQNGGVSRSQAVADSFYVVGTIALLVAVGVFFGLRNLPGEEEKGWRKLIAASRRTKTFEVSGRPGASRVPSYPQLLLRSMSLGLKDVDIGLGYMGGFVARASSVAISLFIPLFVNAYFISSGRCPSNPDHSLDPIEARLKCKRAYIVASILSGFSQLVALLCAPVFGYMSAQYTRYNFPLLLAAVAGIAGYTMFAFIEDPDPKGEHGYNFGPFVIVALLGISQIGAIVCSLGQLARGIETDDTEPSYLLLDGDEGDNTIHPGPEAIPAERAQGSTSSNVEEASPLLPPHTQYPGQESSRASLKGSIAGMYSLAGGAGILLLTKVGGLLFDRVDPGSPFFMMAGFNAVLFAITLACGIWSSRREEKPSLVVHDELLERDEG
jgi:hypothetical protein